MYEREREKDTRGRLKRLFSLKNARGDWRWARIIAMILIALILLVVFFGTMFYTVGVGEACLIVDPITHQISGPTIGPTWSVKWPWQEAIVIHVAMDSLGMWGNGTDKYADFPSVACFSKDQLEMQIDIMTRWSLDVNKLKDLYNQYPACNWKDTVVASIIREQMRIITSTEFSAIQTIEQRDIVRGRISDAIWNKLSVEPSLCGAIINFEFELRNIGYPQAYTDAITAKLAAEQQKLQAEFDAQKRIILQQAEADALIIQVTAEAQAKIIDAQGIQEAINTLVANANMNSSEYSDFLNLYITLKTLEEMALNQGVRFFINWENGIPVLVPTD